MMTALTSVVDTCRLKFWIKIEYIFNLNSFGNKNKT